MSLEDPYKRIAHREVYRNRWLTVEHHDMVHPTGARGEHVLISGAPASGVVVVDNDGLWCFTIQPRFAARRSMLEIVKGGADAGEDALAAARRELQEELGFTALRWDTLGAIYELPSLMQDPIVLFVARDLRPVATDLEETEAITIERMTRDAAVDAALRGGIEDAVTCTAILRANALIS